MDVTKHSKRKSVEIKTPEPADVHGTSHNKHGFNFRRASSGSRSLRSSRHDRKHRKSTAKSLKLPQSWVQRNFTCCGKNADTDSSDDSALESSLYKNSPDEEEIIERLQEAVYEVGHRPTSYEIESEILRWERMLELEQKAYDESGLPKFKYKMFRKNRYLTITKLPLYGTNYESHKKLAKRLKKFKTRSGATRTMKYLRQYMNADDEKDKPTKKRSFFKKAIRKVHPEPFIYKRPITHAATAGRRRIFESRFVARVCAPSQTNSYPIRSDLYQMSENNMIYIYHAQKTIQKEFLKLLQFKKAQTRWLHLLIPPLFKRKITSLRSLAYCIMFHFKYHNNKVDIRFLKKALSQLINLTFYSAVRKLQRMPLKELLPFLAEELLMLTTFHAEEYHYHFGEEILESSTESSTEADENNNRNNNATNKSHTSVKTSSPPSKVNAPNKSADDDVPELVTTSSSTSSTSASDSSSTSTVSSTSSSEDSSSDDNVRRGFDLNELHRKVFGVVEKSPEELRTLLTIRLKRGLNLPYEGELSVLKFLRRERAAKERKLSCWSMNDNMPIDHFIPASISKGNDKICYTIFHAVVVNGNNHFVLKKLPIPRPPIVRVTKAFINKQVGKTLTEKFAHIIRARMLPNAKEIVMKRNLYTWPKYKVRRHLWKLTDHIDDDIYDFLDRLLTCIIVVVDARGEDWSKRPGKQYFLTPPTRRKIPENVVLANYKVAMRKSNFEISTYANIISKQISAKKWIKLLDAKPDVVYHPHSSDESSEDLKIEDNEILDVKSSSGSSSSLSTDSPPSEPEDEVEESRRFSAEDHFIHSGFYHATPFSRKSLYILSHEKLEHRDRRDAIRNLSINLDEEDKAVAIQAGKVKHISAKRWDRLREKVNVGLKKAELKYKPFELKLHEAIEREAERRAKLTLHRTRAKSVEDFAHYTRRRSRGPRRSLSFRNLRQLLDSEPDFFDIQQEENWQSKLTHSKSLSGYDSFQDFEQSPDPLFNESPMLNYCGIGKQLIVDIARGEGSTSTERMTLAHGAERQKIYRPNNIVHTRNSFGL